MRLTAGKSARLRVYFPGESEPFEPADRRCASVRSTYAACPETKRDVLENGKVREKQVVLKHHADRPAFGREVRAARHVVEHDPVERHDPTLDPDQAGERAQQSRLTRAVRAEHRDDLAGSRLDLRLERE